jgi:GNAT superfamily N-acetyltransferase
MQTDAITLVAFRPEHLDGARALSRQVEWPHRIEDWQMMLRLSEGAVALDADSRVVGTILVTAYEQDCAAINMVIVDGEMRGRGLGRRLMENAFKLAGSRPLMLTATADGLPLYKKLGFAECGEIRQHQGHARSVAAPEGVALAATGDIAAIKGLDRDASSADRSRLIDALAGTGTFAVIRRNGVVEGFAALRAFGRGEVVGPVVAANADDARALIAFFVAPRTDAFLRVDTPSDTGLADWLSEIGLVFVGGGVAMRRPGTLSRQQAVRRYALASQALG